MGAFSHPRRGTPRTQQLQGKTAEPRQAPLLRQKGKDWNLRSGLLGQVSVEDGCILAAIK